MREDGDIEKEYFRERKKEIESKIGRLAESIKNLTPLPPKDIAGEEYIRYYKSFIGAECFRLSHEACRIFSPQVLSPVRSDLPIWFQSSNTQPSDTAYCVGNRGENELIFPSGSKLIMIAYPYKKFGKTVFECQLVL